jgi:F-type H+-transporting ATPase subunit a
MNKILLFFTGLVFSTSILLANEMPVATDSVKSAEKKFSPKELIFDHINDAHDWHILTWKGKPVSIPLPVIIHSEVSGWHVFMASKFHHGHEVYQGFQLHLEEGDPYKGKITETAANGNVLVPLDISITKNVLELLIACFLILYIFLSVARKYRKNKMQAPSGLQSLIEPVILFVRDDIAIPSIGKEKHKKFLPFLLTVFFFILVLNLIGMIPIFPGGANVTGNIAVTMVLAVFTFVITTISSNKHYWKDIFNPEVPWWLKYPVPLMPVIEFLQVFIRPSVLMIRLFANILAGHITPIVFISLIFIFGEMHWGLGYGVSPVVMAFDLFLTLLEVLISFLQAYIFTLLSAIYFGMAVAEPEAEHHK